MTDQPQWKATLRKDAEGNTIVSFSLEGEHGHIHMDAPAVNLDPGDLDEALADELRRRAKSCIISWRDDAGLDWAVEARVVARSILVYKLNGAALGEGLVVAVGDRVQGEIGDQDPEWLISYVLGLV